MVKLNKTRSHRVSPSCFLFFRRVSQNIEVWLEGYSSDINIACWGLIGADGAAGRCWGLLGAAGGCWMPEGSINGVECRGLSSTYSCLPYGYPVCPHPSPQTHTYARTNQQTRAQTHTHTHTDRPPGLSFAARGHRAPGAARGFPGYSGVERGRAG